MASSRPDVHNLARLYWHLHRDICGEVHIDMKVLAMILGAIGALTAFGVVVYALIAWFGGTPESRVFGLSISAVIGIPAAGFSFLMFVLSGVFLATGPVIDDPAQDSIAPNDGKPNWMAIALFGGAVLWSAPYGFMTIVHTATGNPSQAADTGIIWVSVALPLICLGFMARHFSRRAVA